MDETDLRDVHMPTGWSAYEANARAHLPAYASFLTKDAGLPDMRPRSARPEATTQGKGFAAAVVEMFDPARLRPWLTDAEWEQVQVILDPAAFAQRVLLPAEARAAPPPRPPEPRLSAAQIQELMDRGYLAEPSVPEGTYVLKCPCSIFAVVKSDGKTLRMIWNGVEFNARCREPPTFRITPLQEMLQRLLQPDVAAFVAFDFQTWFIQLCCHPDVAAHFLTQVDGTLYRVAGVPMGWAWACVVAHCLTVAFARAVLAELGPADARAVLATEFCIDNSVFALAAGLPPDRLLAAVERVATRLGVTLKRSATEAGVCVDWMMYRLDARSHTARFKDDYQERLKGLARRARKGGPTTVADVWHCAGLAIFSLHAARVPLTRAAPLWRWLAANAPPPHVHGRTWGAQRVDCFAHWRLLCDLADLCRQIEIRPPPYVATRPAAGTWGVTDAAGGGTCVSLVFTDATRRLDIYTCRARTIAEKELCAMVTLVEDAVQRRRAAGRATAADRRAEMLPVWSDNEVARVAAERGWALWANGPLAARLEAARREAEEAGWLVVAMRVDTTRCIADAWTRLAREHATVRVGGKRSARPACAHTRTTGRICPCDLAWIAADGAPTERPLAWIADPPALPALPSGVVRTPIR